jgi:23S rRNA pseudouridine955/2504/2580 synthase
MTMDPNTAISNVQWLEITEDVSSQRLDNFLITQLKGVPKSHIYRIVRKGEVRVNKGRADAKYRLSAGDIVRIPPLRRPATDTGEVIINSNLAGLLQHNILYEDDSLLVLNKPTGYAVHGGSGIDSGIIEALRLLNPGQKFLELVHRLDRDTSGCLLIAKKRSALRVLHEQFRSDKITKTYKAVLAGQWARKKLIIDQPLLKNISKGGERMVVISKIGKASQTLFRRLQLFAGATLVEASPITGRTHQIRVHAAFMNHPIIGDERYGFADINKSYKAKGYKKLLLHAETLQFTHPISGKTLAISADLPQHFADFINNEK